MRPGAVAGTANGVTGLASPRVVAGLRGWRGVLVPPPRRDLHISPPFQNLDSSGAGSFGSVDSVSICVR